MVKIYFGTLAELHLAFALCLQTLQISMSHFTVATAPAMSCLYEAPNNKAFILDVYSDDLLTVRI